MKKIVLVVTAILCWGFVSLSAWGAGEEATYQTVVTVEGAGVEDLQTAMDNLPDNAGDVQIKIEKTLYSYVNEFNLSVPTDKGITSLTLSHEGTDTVAIYTKGDDPNTLNFFANGIPLIIDKGVCFGTPTRTYTQSYNYLYGGSKNAAVDGDTSITVNEGGATTAAVYGGGFNGGVNGSTFITAYGAYGEIHGGGRVSAAAGTGNLSADVTGKATIVVDNTVVPEYKAYVTHSWYNGSIYGGGDVELGFKNITGPAIFSAQVKGGVSIDVNCQTSTTDIFGGGCVYPNGDAVDAALNADVIGDVDIVIGERTRSAEDFAATGYLCAVAGGGYINQTVVYEKGNVSAQVYGNVNITAIEDSAAADGKGGIGAIIGGGVVCNGGVDSNATVNGNVTITTSRKAPLFKALGDGYNHVGVSGGGYAWGGVANVNGDVDIHICKAPGQSADYQNVRNLVGGGVASTDGTANVNGSVTIRIDDDIRFEGGEIEGLRQACVTGGGRVTGQNGTANVTGAVNTIIGNGAVFDGDSRIVGGGWITGWYGEANVTGAVTTTVGNGASFDGDCRVIGGGWVADWYGDANVTGAVTTAIGDGASFNGTYRIAGGGWVGGQAGFYGGNANVDSDVQLIIGRNANFAGGYLPSVEEGQAPTSDDKTGIVGGGWVTISGGAANVTGTVTTTVGEGAGFNGTSRVVGGGAISGGCDNTSAATGPISVTLNGISGTLEELFCGSLEGRSPSASADITIKDGYVAYIYDKDGWCAEPITINFLGDCRTDYVFLQGHGHGGANPPKAYLLNIGNGAAPTELMVGGYLYYEYALPWEKIDIHIFDGAVLKKGFTGNLFYYYIQDLAIDEGGTLAICADEGINGSLTGGGTLELLAEDNRLRMENGDAVFTDNIKVKVTNPVEGQVVATTIQSGTRGSFVYDGEGFYIQKKDAYGNYDWYLAKLTAPALTPPEGLQNLVYNGKPQHLVTSGSVEDGTLLYSLDGVNYAEDIPTAIDAGDYEVYYKVQGDEGYSDTEPNVIPVNIGKAAQAPPAVPELASKTANSITLKTIVPQVDGGIVEYSKDGGVTWQTSPVFTDLTANTSYSFAARYGETDNYQASDAGAALTAKTDKSSTGGSIGGVGREEEYGIIVSATAGGTIYPDGSVFVVRGTGKIFTITPDEGYEISDVLVDGQSVGAVKRYTFSNVKKAHTIHVVFVRENTVPEKTDWSNCVHNHSCPIYPFQDANVAKWYHDGIHYCLDEGLMQGYGNGLLGPNRDLSRAELAQILYNRERHPASSWHTSFTDIVPDSWYNDAVTWAAGEGIVKGYSNETFGPDDSITREQLAAMLYRYALAKGYDVSVGEDTNILSFYDFRAMSEYAIPALQWASGSGVMKGKGNGILDPNGNATRAEAAAMLQRFLTSAKIK